MPDRTLYYPVWVSNSGRVSLRWGKPCDSPSEARNVGRTKKPKRDNEGDRP